MNKDYSIKQPKISEANYKILKSLATKGVQDTGATPSKILAINRLMKRYGFILGDLPNEKNTDFIFISETELFGLDRKEFNMKGFGAFSKNRYIYATIN